MPARMVGQLLKEKNLTLSVAESCTGGKIGDLITDIPGSSDYFMGGVIAYSNDVKMRLLCVDKATLILKGAVSREVAIQMADGARKMLGSDIGVSVTGIAGPAGGTAKKPVGLVYVAISSKAASVCTKNLFKGSREEIKKKSADKALKMLEEFVMRRRSGAELVITKIFILTP